jgi:hypothetical protein
MLSSEESRNTKDSDGPDKNIYMSNQYSYRNHIIYYSLNLFLIFSIWTLIDKVHALNISRVKSGHSYGTHYIKMIDLELWIIMST